MSHADEFKSFYPVNIDLTNCDQEPVHLIRTVQPYASLLACRVEDLVILHASDNTNINLGVENQELIGEKLEKLLDEPSVSLVSRRLANYQHPLKINPFQFFLEVEGERRLVNVLLHVHNQILILEFEPVSTKISTSEFQFKLSQIMETIQSITEYEQLYQITANELKQLLGYDRVMVYRFDEKQNGEVVAEVKEDHLEPFLGLRYPATDIPPQVRNLLLLNPVRMVVEVDAKPAMIRPVLTPGTEQPLDLTFATIRGVSPIHIEYLQNMGVKATLTISIIKNGQLWGLFALHHYEPKFTDHSLRNTAKLIGQIFSSHLALYEAKIFRESVLNSRIVGAKLVEQMSARWNVVEGLTTGEYSVMQLTDCSGAGIYKAATRINLGQTPSTEQIDDLIKWLDQQPQQALYYTHRLIDDYPAAAAFADKAAGLLVITLSNDSGVREYIMWFKPAIVQTVNWAGDPAGAVNKTPEKGRLSPRKSFAKWCETVKDNSSEWKQYEIDNALALRNSIKDFIIQKYQQLQNLNFELQDAYKELESFSYTVSHDLRAPLRGIDGFAQILLEDYYDQLDDDGRQTIERIINSTGQMNEFINDMLHYSRLGQSKLIINKINVKNLIDSILEHYTQEIKKRNIIIQIDDHLPPVFGDRVLVKQLFQNLLSNAIKYTQKQPKPIISIKGKGNKQKALFSVSDNGIGFNAEHADRIFNVFTRLTNDPAFEGTGIGLAIVKRIVTRHNGSIWVESELNQGTTFYFEFPVEVGQIQY